MWLGFLQWLIGLTFSHVLLLTVIVWLVSFDFLYIIGNSDCKVDFVIITNLFRIWFLIWLPFLMLIVCQPSKRRKFPSTTSKSFSFFLNLTLMLINIHLLIRVTNSYKKTHFFLIYIIVEIYTNVIIYLLSYWYFLYKIWHQDS